MYPFLDAALPLFAVFLLFTAYGKILLPQTISDIRREPLYR